MAINFPVNPNTGDLYSFGERNWEYTGQGWKLLSQISLANSAFIKANSSFIQANAAFNTANAAFLAANNATDTYVRNHANSAFDQANAAYAQANTNAGNITIIQAVNLTQNTNISDLQAVNLTQNTSINNIESVNLTQNTNITNAQNTADAAFLAANNATDTYVRAHANAAFHQANAAYNQANTNAGNITIIEGVNVTQNTNISNLQAVDLTQNTNITNAQNKADSAFHQANAAYAQANTNTTDITILQAVNVTQNTSISNIEAVNLTQNTNITTAQTKADNAFHQANAAYNQANTNAGAITVIQGVNVTQNTNISNIEGVNLTQNTNISNLEAVNLTQNTNITNAQNSASAAFIRANNSLNANVGGTIGGDVSITGNLTVLGNTFSVSSSQIVANDTLFILGVGNYTGDVLDIGFSSHYNAGVNAHTGLIRDSGTKEWQLFEGYTPEIGANNNININDPSFKIATLNANLHSTSIELNGQDLQTYINGAYNTANGAFNSANVINGVNLTQNTNITNAQNSALAAFNQANAAFVVANNAFTTANGTIAWNTANAAFLAANAATATDTTQNNSITAAFVAANSAGVYANGAFAAANNRTLKTGDTFTGNVTIANGNVTIINTTTSISNTTGALVVTGGVGVRGNVYADNIYDGGIEIIQFANLAFNQANAAFTTANSAGKTIILFSDAPPAGPTNNTLWWQSNTGVLKVWYTDTDGSQWVDASPVAPTSSLLISNDTTSTSTIFPIFTSNTTGALSNVSVSSTKLTYTPSSGTLTAVDFNSTSDLRRKENVQTIENGLQIVQQIDPVSFNWKETGKQGFGVIAQEIEKLLPSIVGEDGEGYKSISYNQLISFLISAVKEQQKQIDELKRKIDAN